MKKGRKPSQNLEELISIMEPIEKRYIAVYLRQFKGENNVYLKLFNLVSKDTNKLNKNTNLNRSEVIKVQLYWKILKALQLFYSEKNPVIRKNNLLSQYEILSNKGMSKHALRVLKNAKDICLKNDFINDVFYINKEETRMLIEESEGLRNEDLISNYNKNSLHHLKMIKQNYSLNKVYLQNKLNLNFFKLSLNKTAYTISNSFSLNLKENEILSIYGKILNNINLGLYFFGIKNYTDANKHLLSAYKIFIMKAGLIKSYKEEFCELLNLICTSYIFNNKYSSLNSWLNKTSSELNKLNLLGTEEKIIINCAYMNIFFKEMKIRKIDYYLSKLNELKPANKNIKYRFIIDFQNIKYYIQKKELITVKKQINNLFNTYPFNYKPNYQLPLKLFNLILLFILKEYSLLDYEIKKTNYYIKKFNYKSNFSNCIISDLNMFCKKSLKSKKNKSFEDLFLIKLKEYTFLEEYRQDFKNYLDFNVFIQ